MDFMAKTRGSVTIDPQVWERAKTEFESVSQEVEDSLRNKLKLSRDNSIEPLKQKKQKLEGTLEDLKGEKEKVQYDIKEKEEELKAVETKIEELNRKQKEIQKELERFKDVFGKQYADNWGEPDDIQEYWVNQLDKSKQELWEIGKNSV